MNFGCNTGLEYQFIGIYSYCLTVECMVCHLEQFLQIQSHLQINTVYHLLMQMITVIHLIIMQICIAIIQLKVLHHQDTERSLLDTENETSDSSVHTAANNEELYFKCGRYTCMGLVCIFYLIT